jgi:uncharacterized protein YjbJ (UPF0337 family)
VPKRINAINPDEKEQKMNWDRVEGSWKQYKGKIKEKWGKLTDDDLDMIAGKRDQFIGKIQERYGIAKDEAERQANDFLKTFRNPEGKSEHSDGKGSMI